MGDSAGPNTARMEERSSATACSAAFSPSMISTGYDGAIRAAMKTRNETAMSVGIAKPSRRRINGSINEAAYEDVLYVAVSGK